MAIHIYIHTFLHTCIGAIALHRGDLEQGRKYLNTAVGLFLSMQKRGVKGDYRTFAHAEALLGAALCQGECWPIYVYVSICLCRVPSPSFKLSFLPTYTNTYQTHRQPFYRLLYIVYCIPLPLTPSIPSLLTFINACKAKLFTEGLKKFERAIDMAVDHLRDEHHVTLIPKYVNIAICSGLFPCRARILCNVEWCIRKP